MVESSIDVHVPDRACLYSSSCRIWPKHVTKLSLMSCSVQQQGVNRQLHVSSAMTFHHQLRLYNAHISCVLASVHSAFADVPIRYAKHQNYPSLHCLRSMEPLLGTPPLPHLQVGLRHLARAASPSQLGAAVHSHCMSRPMQQ